MNARVVSYAPLIIADGDSLHPRGIIFARRSFFFSILFRRSRILESLRIVHTSFFSRREIGENSRFLLIFRFFFVLDNFIYYKFDRWREDFLLLLLVSSLFLARGEIDRTESSRIVEENRLTAFHFSYFILSNFISNF